MKREKLYISTVAEDACGTAAEFGTGLEIAEFCTADNMDTDFGYWDGLVREKLRTAGRAVFHAPFNELHPCAIDPLAAKLAFSRLEQAAALAASYGADRMVVHSGHVPVVYYDCWFVERSAAFWKSFMRERPGGFTLAVENVLERSPEPLAELMERISDPRVGICLDVGHAHASSQIPVREWISVLGGFIKHVHIHNNDGAVDLHCGLGDGTLDMEETLALLEDAAPDATYTIESIQSRPSAEWLAERGFL